MDDEISYAVIAILLTVMALGAIVIYILNSFK